MAADKVDTTRLQRLARAYTESAVFYAAIDLELFTHVANGAGTVTELAPAMGTSELNAERLVAVCLALELLRRDGDRLINAPDCEKFLVKGSDRYAGPWMEFTRPEVPSWFDLTAKLTDPTPPRTLGLYEGLTVERARRYHEATYSIGMGAGRRFCRQVDLTGRRRLLDLGGGSGAYSINAVQAYPGLEAIVFDLPPVTVVTAEYLEANGVADRVSTVGGDFIADPLPTGCDVAVMASNLPIYDADNIQKVVSKTFAALEPGGEMHLVGEMLAPDGVGPLDAALWGMAEIHYGSGGRAHSITECLGYFERAGFESVSEAPFVAGVLHRVSGTKPGG
ncbi:MAG: acetylserotonin O-methyltransferase [Acidimicrobiia bacterium]|nr:acetylserotonin O-methyltransferase [Acidimicrobiia bacterium]